MNQREVSRLSNILHVVRSNPHAVSQTVAVTWRVAELRKAGFDASPHFSWATLQGTRIFQVVVRRSRNSLSLFPPTPGSIRPCWYKDKKGRRHKDPTYVLEDPARLYPANPLNVRSFE